MQITVCIQLYNTASTNQSSARDPSMQGRTGLPNRPGKFSLTDRFCRKNVIIDIIFLWSPAHREFPGVLPAQSEPASMLFSHARVKELQNQSTTLYV